MDHIASIEYFWRGCQMFLHFHHVIRDLSIAIDTMSHSVFAKRKQKHILKPFFFPTEKLTHIHLTTIKIIHVFSHLLAEASND